MHTSKYMLHPQHTRTFSQPKHASREHHKDAVLYLLTVLVLIQHFLGSGEGKPEAVPHGVSNTRECLPQLRLLFSEEA